MRILNIAFALAYVGPDAVGGAEQVLAHIEKGQVAAGHESLVVAAASSHARGRLSGTPSQPEEITPEYYRYRYFEHKRKIDEALASEAIDLVHMHGYDFHEFIPRGDVPVLVTLHLPLKWYPEWIYRARRPNLFMNCVSAAQRTAIADCSLIVQTIANGVPIPPVEPTTIAQRHGAVVLSRICPEKGIHLAIQAARNAGVQLTIAGRVEGYPEHLAYFRQQVLPALDENCRLIGPVGGNEKIALLRSASCLLVPSLAPESSSLVAMEALSCGTPVIAMNTGALPEIVEHGQTGFLVESADEMAKAIALVERIDPVVCHQAAVERFSADRMVYEYLTLYERLLEQNEVALNTAQERSDWQPGT
ncbi:MAG: glycosyltransferase, partial [Acidobacteriaceae bacterium]|nr:glycosyltransferase [Acidobacteriaceae bacterium]